MYLTDYELNQMKKQVHLKMADKAISPYIVRFDLHFIPMCECYDFGDTLSVREAIY